MAAELVTPTDKLSGLPLPIVPDKQWYPYGRPDIADWHHSWHPRLAPELRSVGGLALRNCRLQLTARKFHNEGEHSYHKYYRGPELPDEEDEQFRLVVLSVAGYMPTRGIDLSGEAPREIDLTPRQLSILRKQDSDKEFAYRSFRYGYEPVRDFLSSYCIQNSIGDSRRTQLLVDEFLNTTDNDKRIYLGNLLLAKKSEIASEPIRELYVAAKNKGLLHPRMPHSPHTLVKYKFGTPEKRQKLFPYLVAQLCLQYGISNKVLVGGHLAQ